MDGGRRKRKRKKEEVRYGTQERNRARGNK
jgi:hypothetical protein